MKNINYKSFILKILIITIGILYIFFIYMDFFYKNALISSDTMKYICIILCFLIALLTGKDALNKRDVALLQVGLFITMLADLLLLIFDYFILGISFFCIVQILYSIRYKVAKTYLILINFIKIFLMIMMTYLIVNFFIIKIDILFAVAFFYSICLVTSVGRAIKAYKNNIYPYPNKYMIAYGMILFLLCDINVGIYNITGFIHFSGYFITLLHYTSCLLMWFFYLPSQVLLSLSGYTFNRDKFFL